MRFLGDMGIAGSTILWLKSQGHDAKQLTFVLGFGDIAAAAGTTLPSIIVFRLFDQSPANVSRRLEVVLREASFALDQGSVISVDEFRYRIRRLPITF